MIKKIKKIRVILFILGLLIFFASIASLIFVNYNFGHIIICGGGLTLVLYGLFYEKLAKMKWLTYGIIALGILFLIMILSIGLYGKNDDVTFKEDAVVVLGAAVRGERVTRLLSYRLNKAAEYSEKNPNAVIIVSGGQGPQEHISEASAMERYLVDTGVPKEKIIKEEKASSTYENLLYSKDILDKMFNGPYETAIITNDFHIYRATKLAEKLGFNVTHYNAKIDWHSIPLNYSRECLAVLKLWVMGR